MQSKTGLCCLPGDLRGLRTCQPAILRMLMSLTMTTHTMQAKLLNSCPRKIAYLCRTDTTLLWYVAHAAVLTCSSNHLLVATATVLCRLLTALLLILSQG